MMHLRTNYPIRFTNRPDPEHIKAHAFADQGIVVASVDDPRLDSFERQFLKNIGERLFGRKVA